MRGAAMADAQRTAVDAVSSAAAIVEMWNLTPGVGTTRCTLSVGFTFTRMTAPVRVLVTGAPSSRQDAP
jgi:hypothetical protein